MKTICTIVLLAISALRASAIDVTLAWDQNPEPDVTRYVIEIYDAPTDAWVELGQVNDPTATPENDTPTQIRFQAFPDAESRVRCYAVNSAGLRSLPSSELVIKMPPSAPTGLRYTIQLSGEITLTPAP